jgi:hypothetical protein
MNKLHEKSPCCQAKIYKIGGKRKKCSECGKTWTNWKKKRGRKARRVDKKLVDSILVKGERASHIANRKVALSPQTISQRLKKVMPLCRRITPYPAGWLIIIADAIWFTFKKKRWTLYAIAIRSVVGGKAHYLDPILLPGRETGAGWKKMFDTIAPEIDNRILALVSDGFRGLHQIAKERKWIQQLCHFHLLQQLQVQLGSWKKLPDQPIRKEIYQSVCQLLKTINHESEYALELYELINSPKCPHRYFMICNEMLRRLDNFRAYINHPELHLPHTTGCLESTNNIIRDRCKYLRTTQSLKLRATALLRARQTVTCNYKKMTNFTQN